MLYMNASWVLGIIAGTVVTLAAVTVIALLARRRHHRPMQYEGRLSLHATPRDCYPLIIKRGLKLVLE
jgi:hypothetical protein